MFVTTTRVVGQKGLRVGYFGGLLDGLKALTTIKSLLDRKGWGLYLVYTLVAGLIVAAFSWWMVTMGPATKQALLDYVFPAHWHLAGRMIFDKVFRNLGDQVLANCILHGGMAAISVTCFVFKEVLSRRIENTRSLLKEKHSPWPLWRQGLEELRFAWMYILAYDVILWVAYPPWDWLRTIARILSFVALFVFFNITFLCPLMLRHQIGYARMVRSFFARPLQAFGFAGLFLAPGLIAGRLLASQPWPYVISILLMIHVLTIAPAATAGTWMAARLLPVAQSFPKPGKTTRIVGWISMLLIMLLSVYVFANLADSINKKSQILKCNYTIDWTSLTLEPSFAEPSLRISLDMQIENPTSIDVQIEHSRLVILNAHKTFSEIQLDPISVPCFQITRTTSDKSSWPHVMMLSL